MLVVSLEQSDWVFLFLAKVNNYSEGAFWLFMISQSKKMFQVWFWPSVLNISVTVLLVEKCLS